MNKVKVDWFRGTGPDGEPGERDFDTTKKAAIFLATLAADPEVISAQVENRAETATGNVRRAHWTREAGGRWVQQDKELWA